MAPRESDIDAVILAGGRSRRMGRDKALLPFGGVPTLAEYQLRRLQKLFVRVSLSAKEDKFPFEAPLLLDLYAESSPMIALASILRQSRSGTVFLLGVDMPFVSPRLIGKLLQAAHAHPDVPLVVAGSPQRPEPLCALYRRELLPLVETLLSTGIHRLRALHEQSAPLYVDTEHPEELTNLNHPEEYELSLRRFS